MAKKNALAGASKNSMNELLDLTIGYARVSTFKQFDDGISVEAQAERIEHYAAALDMPKPKILTDAKSGKNLERQEWETAMKLIRQGRVKRLIVYKLDRLSRSLKDLIELAEALQENNCELHVIAENVNTDSSSGRLFFHILGALAQWQREVIGENTKEAFRLKRLRREYTGGSPAFGYRTYPTGRMNRAGREVIGIRVDPDEQKIIRKVLTMWRSGARVIDIYRSLETSGARNRAGTPVTRKQIYRIINGQTKAVGGSHEAENTGERSAAA